MSHWSSGLPVCFPSQGTRFKSPGGYLCETGILLLALSCYSMYIIAKRGINIGITKGGVTEYAEIINEGIKEVRARNIGTQYGRDTW